MTTYEVGSHEKVRKTNKSQVCVQTFDWSFILTSFFKSPTSTRTICPITSFFLPRPLHPPAGCTFVVTTNCWRTHCRYGVVSLLSMHTYSNTIDVKTQSTRPSFFSSNFFCLASHEITRRIRAKEAVHCAHAHNGALHAQLTASANTLG